MRSTHIILAWIAAAAIGAASAYAQVSPFRGSRVSLSPEDYKLLTGAAEQLYTAQAPKLGDERSWRNEKSGNSGSVRIVRIYEWQGLPCRQIRHTIRDKSNKDPDTVSIDRCRISTGEWKVRS